MTGVTTSASAWVRDFAQFLGVNPPNDDETTSILALAGAAAHASERTAAPVACWLAASAGLSAGEALELVRRFVDGDVAT